MYFEILNSAVHWFREPADLMGGQFPRDRHNKIRGIVGTITMQYMVSQSFQGHQLYLIRHYCIYLIRTKYILFMN